MSEGSAALVVVDVQNDFADPKGSLYVRGGEDVIGGINGRIVAADGAGDLVVYTQDWHPEVTPHFAKDGGIWPVHCVMDSWGAEFHPDLLVVDGGEVVRKGVGGEDGYSGFSVRDSETDEESDTRLESLLRERGVNEVMVVGLATDYCVKETVLDALRRGFGVTVVKSCIRGVDLKDGDSAAALEAMSGAGARVVDA